MVGAYHFISNDEVRRQTNQPLLTEIIQARRLTLFGHRLNGRQCRRKADLDFLAFCVLEETTRTTADDLDENGAERPRLLQAVMDRCSRPGPEPTTLEDVGNQWRHALVVLQAGEEEEEEEEDVNITSLAEVITSVCGHAFPGVEKAISAVPSDV